MCTGTRSVAVTVTVRSSWSVSNLDPGDIRRAEPRPIADSAREPRGPALRGPSRQVERGPSSPLCAVVVLASNLAWAPLAVEDQAGPLSPRPARGPAATQAGRASITCQWHPALPVGLASSQQWQWQRQWASPGPPEDAPWPCISDYRPAACIRGRASIADPSRPERSIISS
jgi:hypothetical protein